MKLAVFTDYDSLSTEVAKEIIGLVKQKPSALLCMASGDSPKLTCSKVAEIANREKVDLSKVQFVGLDEWLGIPPGNSGSCNYFFRTFFLRPLQSPPSSVHFFDALSSEPVKECKKMDEFIFQNGPIDLMIVGIGMNGHIGFNEPGISFDKYSHIADLDETTTLVGQKYFDAPVKLTQGITLGLHHLMDSKKLILLANGKRKSEVIEKAVEGEVTNNFPATIVQLHQNCKVMIDEEAAARLKAQGHKTQDSR
jgi:glucosamine-6-phosphate isomerase